MAELLPFLGKLIPLLSSALIAQPLAPIKMEVKRNKSFRPFLDGALNCTFLFIAVSIYVRLCICRASLCVLGLAIQVRRKYTLYDAGITYHAYYMPF